MSSLYLSHIPTTCFQKQLMAFGASIFLLSQPSRQDMMAALGETTGYSALSRMLQLMSADPTGRKILKERPIISSQTIDLQYLRLLPSNTFGREYVRFLDSQNVSPDTRSEVHYVDNEVLAYVMKRYRQIHDFFHTLTGLPVTVEGELALKWFELSQTRYIPMTVLSAIIGPFVANKLERRRLRNIFIPWALQASRHCKPLINVYFEHHFETSLDTLRQQLSLVPAPLIP